MNTTDPWAEAIGFARDAEGKPLLENVLHHIRGAIVEVGFVRRGSITRGLREAYGPFNLEQSVLAEKIDKSLDLLRLSGDIDEFNTSADRVYTPTLPRRVDWGASEVAVLGGTTVAESPTVVRRVAASKTDKDLLNVHMDDELGRPDWRSMLVELGGSDAAYGDATALFEHCQALAGGGERYSLDEPEHMAVLSGRGEFFGRAENVPSGRWQRIDGDGCFPAAIRSGYTTRLVVLSISGNQATLWKPPTVDHWRWIVIGATLALGDPVYRYNPTTGRLDLLTPPPHQIQRAALLSGHQIGPWSWRLDDKACSIIARTMATRT